jgi:hypothetical protein
LKTYRLGNRNHTATIVLNDYQYDRDYKMILVSNKKEITHLIPHIWKVAVTIIYRLVRFWKNLDVTCYPASKRERLSRCCNRKSNEVSWYWLRQLDERRIDWVSDDLFLA